MELEMNSSKSITRSAILGIGSALPDRVLDNHYFEQIVETSDEWIRERTGIRERHFALPTEMNSDFAAGAASRAIRDAGLEPMDIDVLIIATCTQDRQIPSTAVIVQEKIGALNAAAFDLNAACTGFIYGMIVANSLILSGAARHVVVVGSELLSRCINMEDRATCVLFGDGAGAVVMGAARNGNGLLGYYFRSDGRQKELITIPAGGTEMPASHASIDAKLHYVQMKGNEVYKFAVSNLVESAKKALEHGNLTPEDIDLVIPHQANTRILESVAKRLGIDYDSKFFINLPHIGNTSSASIPIALAEARDTGRIKPGQTVLFVAFGGGLTWGGAAVRL